MHYYQLTEDEIQKMLAGVVIKTVQHMEAFSKLTPLEEWNRNLRPAPESIYPMPNGIACPKCGEEMGDKNNALIMSFPPQREVVCLECEHTDYRLS